MSKVQAKVVHYGKNNPQTHRGGVETFARNLRLVFDRVDFMVPDSRDLECVRRERPLVVCDNHWVMDWPNDIPVVGFQHGVAAAKHEQTRSWSDRHLARRQRKAAARPNTTWVACAQWISERFAELHANPADFVIYHPVDFDLFDGQRGDVDPRLVLHDARGLHKGEALIAGIAGRFKGWTFEALDCPPADVPDRMRRARAFVHLSRYEGNSIVCNEAMAMNLPCFFTDVGLLRDDPRPEDVWVIDAPTAFSDQRYLDLQLSKFLRSLDQRTYTPRQWLLRNAHIDVATTRWAQVLAHCQAGWV